MADTRLKDLSQWVDEHGYERIHELSGFEGQRTIKQYLSQGRPPSWKAYHKIKRALEAATQ